MVVVLSLKSMVMSDFYLIKLMPKTRKQKEEDVTNLVEDMNNAKSLVMTNYQGLTVKELEELRAKMREQGVSYRIVKNTLFEVARAKSDLKDIEMEKQAGQMAVAFGMEDEVSPAKLVHDYAKEHKNLEIVAGILDGKFLQQAEVESLAKLPSKDELIAKTVGTIKAPITGFVNVLAGNLRGLVGVLNAIKDTKEA